MCDTLFEQNGSKISRERELNTIEKDSDLRTDHYRIVVKNPIQFRLIIGFISGGSSFRVACRFQLLMKEETGLVSIGNISAMWIVAPWRRKW
jgi:hypothetical protein